MRGNCLYYREEGERWGGVWGGGRKTRKRDIKVTPSGFKRSPVKSVQLCLSVMNTQLCCTHQAESFPPASVVMSVILYSVLFALLYIYIYSVHIVLPTHRLCLSNVSLLLPLYIVVKKCNFLSKWREKSEMSISLCGSSCLWPICISPLYRSCISGAWMHKWLTCPHICLYPSTPPFTHQTRRRLISTSFLDFLISLRSAVPVKISHVTFFLFLNISPSPQC